MDAVSPSDKVSLLNIAVESLTQGTGHCTTEKTIVCNNNQTFIFVPFGYVIMYNYIAMVYSPGYFYS